MMSDLCSDFVFKFTEIMLFSEMLSFELLGVLSFFGLTDLLFQKQPFLDVLQNRFS